MRTKPPEPSLGLLGALWALFGLYRGSLGALLGLFCGLLGSSWGCFGHRCFHHLEGDGDGEKTATQVGNFFLWYEKSCVTSCKKSRTIG